MFTQPLPDLRFTTHHALAHRLLLSTLLGKPVRISAIRPNSPSNPGLAPHEISLLRLLESLTNGSQIEISYTGTVLRYVPGLITGCVAGRGANADGALIHSVDARVERGISYLILPLLILGAFAKAKVNVLFTGPGVITSCVEKYGDVSVDTVRTAVLPILARFGIERDLEIRVNKRSNPAAPRGVGGAGEVQVVFGHQVRVPKTLHLLGPGRVKSVRGVAYATGVSGGNNARMIESARSVLNKVVGDVYIFSDVASASLVEAPTKDDPRAKKKVGLGFGLSLVAETTSKCLYSADAASPPEGGVTPEEIGLKAAYFLLESIEKGGCVAIEAAPLVTILMSMGSEDVGRVQLGRNVLASEGMIQLARDMSVFGAAGWGIRDADSATEKEQGQLTVSIVGNGVGNVGRKIG